jgi:hypothetical protein
MQKITSLVVALAALVALPALAGEHPVKEDGIFFKPGKGLVLESEDGLFRIRMKPRVQMLYTIEQEEQDAPQQLFQLRRARLAFTGHAFDPKSGFKFELSVSPRDVSTKGGPVVTRTPLLDYFVFFEHNRDASIRAGQYKIVYSRQRVWSSSNLQMVDRSPTQAEFNLDRDVGVTLYSKNLFGLDLFRYYAFIGQGDGRDLFQFSDFGLLYFLRAEYSPFGQFDDNKPVDFKRRRKPGLTVSAAYAFADGARRNRVNLGSAFADGGSADLHNATADVVLKWAGFSVLAEGHMRAAGSRDAGDAVDENGDPIEAELVRQGYGYFLQAGYLLPGLPLEVSTRYSNVSPFGESSLQPLNELGAGLSWYIQKHSVKVQTDLFRKWGAELDDGSEVAFRFQVEAGF